MNTKNINSNGNGHRGKDLHLKDASAIVTVRDYIAVVYRSRWIIAIVFLLSMSAAFYYAFTTPPTFEASTTIMIDESQDMGQSLFQVGALSKQRTLINNQVEILKSRALTQAVLELLLNSPYRDSLSLVRDIGVKTTLADAFTILRGALTIVPVRDTDLINIRVKAPGSFEAAFLTNSVAEAYQHLDRNFTQGEISQIVQFLDSQLDRKDKELKGSEEILKEFLEQEKIASLSDEATQIVEQGAVFESLYREALIDAEVKRKRLDYLKDQLGRSKETLEAEIARVSSPLILQLRKEMARMERTIAVYLSQGVGENDPQVRREHQMLGAIKKKLTEETRKLIVNGLPANDPLARAQDMVVKILEIETDLAALSVRAKELHKVVISYTKKLEALPDKNVQLARLERNRKVDENLYMMMREKYEESRITQAGQIGKVRILDKAVPPRSQISPKKKLNLFLGFIIVSPLRHSYETEERR